MKLTVAIFTFLAAIAAIKANPISINGNNVGDIVTVGVNANANLSSDINVNVITALLALVNQQAAIINPQADGSVPQTPDISSFISPELLNEVKNIKITPEMIDGLKKLIN
ncbi:hypothetical protein ACKWTF_013071 [Chironomus riparius]